MLRRFALALFAVAIALVVACGHQVTPEPSADNSNLAGKMVIRFRTNAALNFNAYTYAIIIDTCGLGAPLPNVYNTSFNGYSFAFLLGGSYGTAYPVLQQYIVNSNQANPLSPQTVPYNPSLTSLQLDSNGQNTEFELIFSREQLDNPLQVAQPCPNITPAPSTGASPGVSPTATATATGTGATSSASPAATLTPNPSATSMPTTSAQQYWYFNFFTINTSTRAIVDSLGIGGATDDTFNGVGVDVNLTNTYPIFKATGGTLPSDPAAQLEGGEIDNYM